MNGEGRGATGIPLHLLGLCEQSSAEELAPVAAVVRSEVTVVQSTPAGVTGTVDVWSVKSNDIIISRLVEVSPLDRDMG